MRSTTFVITALALATPSLATFGWLHDTPSKCDDKSYPYLKNRNFWQHKTTDCQTTTAIYIPLVPATTPCDCAKPTTVYIPPAPIVTPPPVTETEIYNPPVPAPTPIFTKTAPSESEPSITIPTALQPTIVPTTLQPTIVPTTTRGVNTTPRVSGTGAPSSVPVPSTFPGNGARTLGWSVGSVVLGSLGVVVGILS